MLPLEIWSQIRSLWDKQRGYFQTSRGYLPFSLGWNEDNESILTKHLQNTKGLVLVFTTGIAQKGWAVGWCLPLRGWFKTMVLVPAWTGWPKVYNGTWDWLCCFCPLPSLCSSCLHPPALLPWDPAIHHPTAIPHSPPPLPVLVGRCREWNVSPPGQSCPDALEPSQLGGGEGMACGAGGCLSAAGPVPGSILSGHCRGAWLGAVSQPGLRDSYCSVFSSRTLAQVRSREHSAQNADTG